MKQVVFTLVALMLSVALVSSWSLARGEQCETARNLKAGEEAPCGGVLIPSSVSKVCADAIIDLDRCLLREERASSTLEAEASARCTPKTVFVTKPAPEKSCPSGYWYAVSFSAGVVLDQLAARAFR